MEQVKETIHICNTYFEKELKEKKPVALEKAVLLHPIFLQLQYLPIIYAKNIAVSHMPSEKYLKNHPLINMHLLDQSSFDDIQFVQGWAASNEINLWASKRGLSYQMCDFDIAKKINSKVYSFKNNPRLEEADLFNSLEEVEKWLEKGSYPKVLKSEYSTAGRGCIILNDKKEFQKNNVKLFVIKEFNHDRFIIGEPWVKRMKDFSSQWNIEKNGERQFVGLTFFESDPKGVYRKTYVTKNNSFSGYEKFLEVHFYYAEKMLEKLIEEGYFGHVGFDAMIYEINNMIKLHPIVEINARKTMSFVAIACQKRFFPKNDILFSFLPTKKRQEGLLPSHIQINENTTIEFHHQIFLEKL